ncbi:MAG: agmatinase [Candidatus Poribacteria bacterium]|nr:agmatinase [Candidatus Poribacteria bacterium]
MPNERDIPFLALLNVSLDQADAVVVPVPFERTVSYGKGTDGGPAALLHATSQIEFFDEETEIDFETYPLIHTATPVVMDASLPIKACLDAITERFKAYRGTFTLALGGEHSLTYGAVKGLVEDVSRLTIVQLDAHADLADELDGERWSHGAVMKRLWDEGATLIQIGIRSLSKAEYVLARDGDRITTFFAHNLPERWDEAMRLLGALEGEIYFTLDVDGLDPSIIPSTGTPQPDGLSWRQTMEAMRAVFIESKCRVAGADVVEFIPSPHPPGCDLVAAKLTTRLLAYWGAGQRAEVKR